MEDRQPDVMNFARAIQHGDEVHRQWLLDAAKAYVAGEPLPPPRSGDDERHYLSAIKLRLEALYEMTPLPNIREQISDEIDWLDERIQKLMARMSDLE